VIASHYARPVLRTIASRVSLRTEASADSQAVGELAAGEVFDVLDNSLGWAWGYAGKDRLVGYIPSDALA
jgi:hypothetical protein